MMYKRPSRLLVTAGHHDISLTERALAYESRFEKPDIFTCRTKTTFGRTDVNDIAIIAYLSHPYNNSSHVQNISLPRVKEKFHGHATVTGWGRIKEKGDTSDILRKVKIRMVEADLCKKCIRSGE
ncbi:Trypsin-1 [Orchesella cincta]|uniref:Trypsin-1 n=1 Tax=Orchesella cincta TaxID=48709 RepID=A0A1D2M224_ORCCI|nr:Trypsin-1 [Orchesella cincta]